MSAEHLTLNYRGYIYATQSGPYEFRAGISDDIMLF
jgi:hypothetical protein